MKSIAKLTLVMLALVATTAAAQNSANITATAVVQQPITVTGSTTLDFANVFPGVAKTVAVSDLTAGLFTVAGQASTNVNLALTLPANLVNGGNNLPIGTWTGYKNTTNNATAGGAAFSPVNGANGGLVLSGTGAGFVFLGATVTPAINLPAGTYTSTITLTATY